MMGVTNEGINHMLDVSLNGAAQVTVWYIGLIDASGYKADLSTDTMASHPFWTEAVGYSEAVRQTWVEASAASQQTLTSTDATFTMTGAATIAGFFLTSVSTKSGTTGTLLLTKLFDDGNRTFAAGELCKVALSITGTDGTL